jgi:hypothetical protein
MLLLNADFGIALIFINLTLKIIKIIINMALYRFVTFQRTKFSVKRCRMNVSWQRRLLLILLVTLLTLTLFTSALAAKPEFFTVHVDDTYEVGECDGFTIINHEEGKAKFSTHFDQDGNFVMNIGRFSLRHTLSNSVTGKSLFSPDVGIDKFTIHQDGSATLAVIGLITRIVVPGEGLVFARFGRLVINADTGETIFEAGRWDDFADLIPVLCSALE